MSPGSEPERDDTGLPPVDIEIPDDARELDRDVQAYHREQRAQRRNQRSRRLHGRLSRDSMVVPLLICCLVFALISGTLLTLFTATSIDLPGRTGAGSPPAPHVVGAPSLGNATVTVAGKSRALYSIQPAVLLMIPANCACSAAAAQVASQAAESNVPAYVLYTGRGSAKAGQIASAVGYGLRTARDVTGKLDNGYTGLTAFLVSPAGKVSYAQDLQHAGDLSRLLALANL